MERQIVAHFSPALPADPPSAAANWGLGHARLAILDLSAAGLQPMASHDQRIWTVFNGEIYNYLEIRDELIALGHHFHTATDTEVLLTSYRQWGTECLRRFVGMFAFVLVDLDSGIVFAARDRLGIKPIYFWNGPHYALVVSEPKQLLASPDFRPRVHRQQILDFLIDGVLGHEPDICCFANVRPLPAAHSLQWKLGTEPDLAKARAYWQPTTKVEPQSWHEAVEKTGVLFRDAVRLRLRSDVPIGTCLSGGVDSSSIVGVAAREHSLKMKTFSICSEDPRFDEQFYIDSVNRHCQTESVKHFLSADRVIEELDSLVYYQDEPFRSISQYGEFVVMRLARENGVTVLLNGQGGDEVMCGYRKFTFFFLRQLWASRKFAALGYHTWKNLWNGDRGLWDLKGGFRYFPTWLRPQTFSWSNMLRHNWATHSRMPWQQRMGKTIDLHEHQWADLAHWSLPLLLRYQDRNSMAHGIEGRVPMTDHRLVEHLLTVPEAYFFEGGRTKRILLDALGDTVPPPVRYRRTKMGFETPQAAWLRGKLGAHLENCVRNSQRLSEILDTNAVANSMQACRRGQFKLPHHSLFAPGVLAIWMERFQVDPE